MQSEFFQTVLKSLIAVSVLFTLTWLAGKRKLSDLSLFQLSSLVAAAAAAALFALGVGYLRGITAILIIALVVFLADLIPARIRQNKSDSAGLRPAGRRPQESKEPAMAARPFAPRPRRGLALNIIIDGKIIQEHLSISHKDINWILNELKNRNIHSHEVLLAYFDCDDEFFVYVHKEETRI